MSFADLPHIRRTLLTPGSFQERYGDRPQTFADGELPGDAWRALALRGWTFRKVKFTKTEFLTNRFENVTFENCEFDRVTVKNCEFINCIFKDCTISSGVWFNTRFRGGNINGLHMVKSMESDDAIKWEQLQFDSIRLENIRPEDRSGHWVNCEFSNAVLYNGDFRYVRMLKPTFKQCEFHAMNGGAGVQKALFEKCVFSKNFLWVRTIGGYLKNVKFDENEGVTLVGLLEDAEIMPSKIGTEVESAHRVVFRAPQGFVAMHYGEDVKIEGVPAGNVNLALGGKRITVENIHGNDLNLFDGIYEDCNFRNIEVNELDLSRSKFIRCEFTNVLVKKRIAMIDGLAEFTDCKFDRFRRNPEVQVFSYDDIPPLDYLFPFESAPGVNKP